MLDWFRSAQHPFQRKFWYLYDDALWETTLQYGSAHVKVDAKSCFSTHLCGESAKMFLILLIFYCNKVFKKQRKKKLTKKQKQNKQTRNPEAELQKLLYFGRTTNCMIITSNPIQLIFIRCNRSRWNICNTHKCAHLDETKSE